MEPTVLKRPLATSRKALGTLGRHFGAVVLISAALALVRAPLDHYLYGSLVGFGQPLQADDGKMFSYVLADAGLLLALEVILGPILAAAAVYFTKRDHAGKPSTLSGALTFAGRSYRHLILPHILATLSIQLGLVVLIPGLLFYALYAFVWPVACLERGGWALDRSKALTYGRRSAIYWVVIPMVVLMQVKLYTVDLPVLSMGFVPLLVNDIANQLFTWFLLSYFTWLYLDRIDEIQLKQAAKADTEESGPAGS